MICSIETIMKAVDVLDKSSMLNDMDVSNDSRIGHEERAYVYAVTRRILRDDDAASDATQDALLLAFRHRAQFRGDSAYKTWLYRIAVMTALGQLRKERRLRSRVVLAASEQSGSRDLGPDMVDPRPSPESDAAATELAGRLGRALQTLSDGHRRVFLLRTEEWRESEIARELGISVANVKIRLHRARAGLRAALGDLSGPARSASRARRDTPAEATATSQAS